MKAVVKYQAGAKMVRLEHVEIPLPAAGQVQIKVHYSGICGTDIHIYKDDGGYKTNPPVTLGHEFSGVVEQVGAGVDPAFVGKRVISETYFHTCGQCSFCTTGRKNLCPERLSIGSGVNGTMAEYVVVPVGNIHLIPESVGLQEAAMTEPLACCAQAVLEKGHIKPGDRILITGPGAIGLMCLQLAVLCGGRVVMAGMESDAPRLQLALELGAEQIVRSDGAHGMDNVKACFGDAGADIVLECAGAGAAINLSLEVIRKGGRFVQVGLTGKPTTLDMNLITLKELTLAGTFAQKPQWWTRSLELMGQGKLRLQPLISNVMPLAQWQEAFDLYAGGAGLKYLLTPLQ